MSTFDKVKEGIIDKLGVDESAITEEAHFVNDLGRLFRYRRTNYGI